MIPSGHNFTLQIQKGLFDTKIEHKDVTYNR